MSDVALSGKANSKWFAYPAVVVLLAAFAILAVTSTFDKAATSDEVVHLLAGVSYWRLNDYRIDPENGNLPQRWMALPMLAGKCTLPSFERPAKQDEWRLAQEFFYELGNDVERMLLLGRTMIVILAVVLGALVYAWSAKLYGRAGGIISLVLYCFSTAVLANGRVMTSDLVASLFFPASLWCLWAMLHRFTPMTVLRSAVVMGLLFVSKMSAILIVPMGLALAAIRLIDGRPLPVKFGAARQIDRRCDQSLLLLGAVVFHMIVVFVTIWAFYGFRFSMMPYSKLALRQSEVCWAKLATWPYPLDNTILFLRDTHLLPEGYLFGMGHVLRYADYRPAFLAGRYSVHGWWWFFPYCLLIKTQLSLFAILALAMIAAAVKWRAGSKNRDEAGPSGLWASFYRTAPLWALLVVYWATMLTSHMNIGHRHILPTYPAMFILAGGAATLFRGRGRTAAIAAVCLLLVLYAGEAVRIYPHYIAYFNQLVGGPANGYRHLVDSSLDWGQDTPGLKKWLDRKGLSNQSGTPVYLAYFGNGSPTYYGVNVRRLRGFVDADLAGRRPYVELEGGYYCIGASMLPCVLTKPMGPWSTYSETVYRTASETLRQLDALDPGSRRDWRGPNGETYEEIRDTCDDFRQARLMSYLRHRRCDDHIGYSILIYHLTDDEVEEALHGRPKEMVFADRPMIVKLLSE